MASWEQTFGHGRFGARQRDDESKWLFSNGELDLIADLMSARYAAMSLDEWAALPNALSALFAWSQSGHASDARAYVEDAVQKDTGLIRMLEVMTSQVSSTGGNYNTLTRANVSPFLDYDLARDRLRILASMADNDLRPRIETLLKVFENADKF